MDPASSSQPLLSSDSNTKPHPTYNTQHGNGSAGASELPLTQAGSKLITFRKDDPEDPRNWTPLRKWTVVFFITLIDLTVSFGASGYSPAMADFAHDFEISNEVAVLGLSLYILGLAAGPMSLAPLSEYYGRTPLYLIPYGIFLCCLLGTALVQNLSTFLTLRVFSGAFASVTVANFGGTIADMWEKHEVGPAMSIYLWASVAGSPIGYFLMSLVAQEHGWRDVFWALLGICGGIWLMLAVVLTLGNNETRRSVLLRRKAAKLRRAGYTVEVPEEARAKNVRDLFSTILTRPFRFLATEAIIIFAALYNGYLYGLSFLFNGAYKLVFGRKGYGFDTVHVGLAFLGLTLGMTLGPISNIWQERHYQKRIHQDGTINSANDFEVSATSPLDGDQKFKNMPEARLQLSKFASITLAISLLWFAWTSEPKNEFHWIVPILATVLFGWSFYTLILMTYMYVAGAYMVYSASALAGVALIRNLAGAIFPLFGNQLFENAGYAWAGTLLALLAMILIPIPYILDRYGTRLRARSPWARHHMDDEK